MKKPATHQEAKEKLFENSYNEAVKLHSVMKICKVKNLDKETFDKWFDLKEYLKGIEKEFFKKQELVLDGYGVKPDSLSQRFIGFEDHPERTEIMKKLGEIQYANSINFVKKHFSIFSDRAQLYDKIIVVSHDLDSDQVDEWLIKYLVKK